MKNKLLMLALGSLLSACGSYTPMPVVAFGVSADDTKSEVTVTKTVIPADPAKGTNETVTWSATDAGAVNFNFTSRPGSQAGYITGFKVVRDIIDGTDVTANVPRVVAKSNIYVPSGFACPEASQTQSCIGPNAIAANGVTSATLSIDFASGLVSLVKMKDASVTRIVDVTFVGTSSTGQAFEIPVQGVIAVGVKADK